MGFFKMFGKKVNEEIDEITDDKCCTTLKDCKNRKDRHLSNDCYSKIFNK